LKKEDLSLLCDQDFSVLAFEEMILSKTLPLNSFFNEQPSKLFSGNFGQLSSY